jgi:hypothetical protein
MRLNKRHHRLPGVVPVDRAQVVVQLLQRPDVARLVVDSQVEVILAEVDPHGVEIQVEVERLAPVHFILKSLVF